MSFDTFKIRISLFYMRENTELVYILQNSLNKALNIFSNRVYSEPFSFDFGAPRYYLDFFDLFKIRILVYYMRETIELVYILQNRVEKCIKYSF